MSLVEVRIAGRYKLGAKIGKGRYSEVYQAFNVLSDNVFAVKFEELKAKYPQLLYEAKILHNIQGGTGIPCLNWCGQEGDYNVMVMEHLGENLETLFNKCKRKFTLKTVLMIADQLLNNIEYVHQKNYIHRDIKPKNFVLGIGKRCHIIHMIDFGLAKRFKDLKSGEHIGFRANKPFIGSSSYASLNTHKTIEQSRRDDLESFAFTLIYFLKGSLPWRNTKVQNKDGKLKAICKQKEEIETEKLCEGLPKEISLILEYSRRLKFEEKPDYNALRQILRDLAYRNDIEFDYVYDWVLIPLSHEIPELFISMPLEHSQYDRKLMQRILSESETQARNIDSSTNRVTHTEESHNRLNPNAPKGTNASNKSPNQGEKKNCRVY